MFRKKKPTYAAQLADLNAAVARLREDVQKLPAEIAEAARKGANRTAKGLR